VSFARQLDFLSRLVARVIEPRPSAPAPRGDDAALAARCRELLHGFAADDFAARVRVRWNARMRSTAGTAFPAKALICLNPRLREFGDAETDRTLRHELAHLLAHQRAAAAASPRTGASGGARVPTSASPTRPAATRCRSRAGR